MIPVFINGLIPGNASITEGDNGGSIAAIFDTEYLKEDERFKVLIAYSNEDGELHSEIDEKYIGKTLTLRIRDAGTKPIEAKIKCEPYGLCYTAKIVIDYVYGSAAEVHGNWNTDENYANAQEKMHEFIKQHKYSNPWIRRFHYFVLAGSVFLGLFLTGWVGVAAAAGVILLLEIVGPYAIGLKPFRLTRRSG